MPYTIMKGLLWFAMAFALGGVIGWMLASLRYRRIRSVSARSDVGAADRAELDRLRGRVANLEPAVSDRDRLRDELARSQAELEGAHNELRRAGLLAEDDPAVQPQVAGVVTIPADPTVSADAAGDPEATQTGEQAESRGAPGDETRSTDASPSREALPELDLDHAQEVLGRPVSTSDLKVVEGIGPKIEELCNGIGVITWSDLAKIEVSLLRTMLNDAGSRFQIHDPSTWPRQGELLAEGRWEEFVAFTEELKGGRPPS